MPEISAIKPTEVKLKEKPKFSYNTGAYDSYIQEGFSLPIRLPDRWEREFLSKVDLLQGKIKIRILNMIRQRAIDYSSDKEEKKEYLTLPRIGLQRITKRSIFLCVLTLKEPIFNKQNI